jgi:hypothetical protein
MNTGTHRTKRHVGPRPLGSKPSAQAWNSDEFASELGRASDIGVAKLSDKELLRVCAGAHQHIKIHFLVDARPFFIELWTRIEEKRVPYNKVQAARLLGCSLRWIEAIIAGTARKGTKREAAHPGAATRRFEPRTVQEYVADIRSFAEKKLKTLWVHGASDRYRNICGLLEEHFADAARIDHIDDLNRRADSVPQAEAQ